MAKSRRFRAAAIPLGVVLGLAAAPGCGGSGSGPASSARNGGYAGLEQSHPKPAPPLVLRDSLGHKVNLASYRGRAVLVTFIYDHCPDICPLIVGHLHTAQAELGAEAKRLQIIAVSVDPRGDTPKTVNAFLAAHQMTGRMEYLIGSAPQLKRTWRAWDVTSKSTPTRQNPAAVEHSAAIFGISGSGRLTTLYPATFRPSEIVHDVPLLASS